MLKNIYALLHLIRFKTYGWYQKRYLALGGCLCCEGFSSVLGSVINLVSVGVCRGDSFVERMVSNSRVEIKKFNGQNFELWKLKMEHLLVDKE